MNSGHDCLGTYLLDILPYLFACPIGFLLPILINMVQNRGQASFVANVCMFLIFVLNKSICFLVDCIIRQMHAQVFKVVALW